MSPAQSLSSCMRRLCLLVLLASFLTGCAHMPATGAFPQWLARDAAEEGLDPKSSCIVEFRGGSRNKTVTVPVSAETRVQDALEVSRATSKFRNLSVFVIRATPQGPQPALKMACRFDRKERRIGFESDYAVLPGDRIVVSEDHSRKIDQIVSSVVGPSVSSRYYRSITVRHANGT